jgi:ATP-dependent exoDNAse (exonuclease V) beta subunit
VPAVGDQALDDSWVEPLSPALYPPIEQRQSPAAADGVPRFPGRDTVLERPDGAMPGSHTVRPGHYVLSDEAADETYSVVWWDPSLLDRPGDDTRGLRRDDLISKSARPEDVAEDRARYDTWRSDRAAVHARASAPSIAIVTATEYVKSRFVAHGDQDRSPGAVVVADAGGRLEPRPTGRRFGVLVHALLAVVPLDASAEAIEELAVLHARVLGATKAERTAAVAVVERTLRHEVLQAARLALAAGRQCRREAPISIVRDGVLIDGQIDLAFESEDGWTVVDFKTDAELGMAEDVYRRQVALYVDALAAITGTPAAGTILRV